jgi:hypothetical protein
MKLSEVRALVRPAAPEFDPVRRRLARCHNVAGLRAAARRMLPRAVFDYVDGAADEEVSLAANRLVFREFAFLPRAAQDVSVASLATRVLGSDLAAPFGLAPTGYSRLVHPAGELAAVRAAAAGLGGPGAAGTPGGVGAPVPYALSTMGTTSIEDVGATGHPAWWFQLYVLRDRGLTWALLDRAAAAGVDFSIFPAGAIQCRATGRGPAAGAERGGRAGHRASRAGSAGSVPVPWRGWLEVIVFAALGDHGGHQIPQRALQVLLGDVGGLAVGVHVVDRLAGPRPVWGWGVQMGIGGQVVPAGGVLPGRGVHRAVEYRAIPAHPGDGNDRHSRIVPGQQAYQPRRRQSAAPGQQIRPRPGLVARRFAGGTGRAQPDRHVHRAQAVQQLAGVLSGDVGEHIA